MAKKWVFAEMVKGEQDTVGLIAYALYKYRKHQLAHSLLEKGESDESIRQQMQIFHDQTLLSSGIQTYQDKAKVFLDWLIKENERTLQHEHQQFLEALERDNRKALDQLQRQHQQALEDQQQILQQREQSLKQQEQAYKQREQDFNKQLNSLQRQWDEQYKTIAQNTKDALLQQMTEFVVAKKNRTQKFLGWLFSGIPTALASLLLLVMFFGTAALFVSETMQNTLVLQALNAMFDVELQSAETPPPSKWLSKE